MDDRLAILSARLRATGGKGYATPRSAPAVVPAPSVPAEERLALSLREAAALVGVHPKTLSKWPLPFFKNGRIVRVLRDDLKKYMSRASSTPDGECHGIADN